MRSARKWPSLDIMNNTAILPFLFSLTQFLEQYFNLANRQAETYTGRFLMFSVITNIYNKKTKGPTLMELFTATEK